MAIRCEFSPGRLFRYTWETDVLPEPGKGLCAFIGLNPSTADENGPDPTVKRCMEYAKRWGYGRFLMLNLFAFRSTDPKVMLSAPHPIGSDNDLYLRERGINADLVVAAWGNHGLHRDRWITVYEMIPCLHVLTLTQKGQPHHPLYLRGDLQPVRWQR